MTTIAAILFMTSSFSMASAPQGDEPEIKTFQFFVKTLTGKAISLSVNKDGTVADVKRAISEKEDISVDVQQLFSQGRPLADDQLLAPMNLQKVGSLRLVISRPVLEDAEATPASAAAAAATAPDVTDERADIERQMAALQERLDGMK